ncbi:MAG: ABC transporter ATP-binding protein/permease [Lachnospiraceae bacterium]|nr:ABC transporter ATP-binding protein/permease [Lachnospiraceae bacterium]
MARMGSMGGGASKRAAMAANMPKLENPGKIFKRLMVYVFSRYLGWFLFVLFCIVVSVLANAKGTMFTKSLIDDYIIPLTKQAEPDFGPLMSAMVRVAGFYAIGIFCMFVQQRIMIYITQGALKNLRDNLFAHMSKLPIKYFDTHTHGDIMSVYTNDIDTLRQMISQSIVSLFQSVVTIITVLIYMFILSIPLTVITLFMVGVTMRFAAFVTSRSGKYFKKQQDSLGALNGYIEEMIEGQRVVKVFCHENEALERFETLNDELYDSAFNANAYSNSMGPINAQIGNISYVICAVVGGLLAIYHVGGLTIGKLVSFLTFNKSFNMPISQVAMQFNSIIMALAGAKRIFDLLDEPEESDEGYVNLVYARKENGEIVESDVRTGLWAWKHTHRADNSVTYVELKGDIVMDMVDFGYTDDRLVLQDIVLHANPGEKIAFVGSTGAGKTTITNLINRFYDIQDGKIRFDGINVNKIKKGDLRKSLGMVLQDTHLFTATVMENIRFGNPEATDEQVINAAKLTNADSFIRQLPQGYDTVIKGDGSGLSQGQRQLLSIARAAVADPPALILDEATSSIDTRTERIVQDGMDKLMKGRTTFVIAHRLSTVKNSDCIMVLEHGRIVERGTHEELLKLGGRYHDLYTGKSVGLA